MIEIGRDRKQKVKSTPENEKKSAQKNKELCSKGDLIDKKSTEIVKKHSHLLNFENLTKTIKVDS